MKVSAAKVPLELRAFSKYTSGKMKKKTQNRLLIGITILSFIIRFIFLFFFRNDYFQAAVIAANGELARQLVTNHRFSINEEYLDQIQALQVREGILIDVKDWPPESMKSKIAAPAVADTPGYAVLLALTWALFGQMNYIYMQIIQVVIDALMCLAFFWIGKKLFSTPIGLISAFLFAIYPPEVRLAVNAARDIWANLCVFGSVVLFYSIIFKQTWRRFRIYLAYGIFVGLICWIRPTVFLFPLIAGPIFIRYLGWKRTIGYVLTTYSSIAVFFLLPYLSFNQAHYHRYFVGPLPLLMWNGIGEFKNKWNIRYGDENAGKYVLEACGALDSYQPQFQDCLMKKIRGIIKQEPGWFVNTVIKRIPRILTLEVMRWDLGRLFKPDDRLWQRKSDHLRSFLAPLARLGRIYNIFISIALNGRVLFIMFMIGLLVFRNRLKILLPLVLTVLYFAIIFSPFLVQGRYVMPMIISYCTVSAALIGLVFSKISALFRSNNL